MAKIQVVHPETKEAIKPKKRYYSAKLAFQGVQIILQAIIIYLLLK